jgi:hypothetical protein
VLQYDTTILENLADSILRVKMEAPRFSSLHDIRTQNTMARKFVYLETTVTNKVNTELARSSELLVSYLNV